LWSGERSRSSSSKDTTGGTSYDVARDGQRFLMLEPVVAQTAPVTHLNVVLNG